MIPLKRQMTELQFLCLILKLGLYSGIICLILHSLFIPIENKFEPLRYLFVLFEHKKAEEAIASNNIKELAMLGCHSLAVPSTFQN